MNRALAGVLAGVLCLALHGAAFAKDFKGIFHEFDLDPIGFNQYIDDIKGAGAGFVAVDIGWYEWEPLPGEPPFGGPVLPPCAPEQVEFEGRCFKIPTHIDTAIRRYSTSDPADPGITKVIAVLVGTPDWANQKRRMRSQGPGFQSPCVLPNLDGKPQPDSHYCIADEDYFEDFARFAALIAKRYDGTSGNGRVHEFVIWNEVNHRAKFGFDVGTPPAGYPGGLPRYWIDSHNCLFGKAFDAIRRYNATAPIRISLAPYHGAGDFVNQPEKHSGFTIIDELAAYGGQTSCFQEPVTTGPPRDWLVTTHPYAASTGGVVFDPQDDWRLESQDWKFITPSTIGRLAGWLHKNHPTHARNVLAGEVGFSSFSVSQEEQAHATCTAYRQALATPDIEAHVTFRYRDRKVVCEELDDCLGLNTRDGDPKLAWRTWSTMDELPPYGCGFELEVPGGERGVLLSQYLINGRHQATTRIPVRVPPPPEATWLLLRRNKGLEAVTREIFECVKEAAGVQSRYFLSTDVQCAGFTNMGSVGFVYTSADAAPGLSEVVQCVSAGDDHVVTPKATGCAVGSSEGSLGWTFRSVNDGSVLEGQGGTREVVFTVSLLSAAYGPVTVTYTTAGGSAQAGIDYLPVSGTLTFPPGTTSQTVSVSVLGDTVAESDETFSLIVNGPPGSIITGSAGTAAILDDDNGLSIDDRTVAEGAAVNAAFQVSLGMPRAQAVTVRYETVDGTARAGLDYEAVSGTITFSPGRTNQTIIVPIVSDTVSEPDEAYLMRLFDPSGAPLRRAEATGTITNPPPAAKAPMYRAYSRTSDYHFFTTDPGSHEFAVGVLGFQDESDPIPFYVWNVRQTGTVPLFRMYNPNLGRHFYTAGVADRDFLIGIGMSYEKEEGFIYPLDAPGPGVTELFKLYNNNSGTHLFTADPAQRDFILTTFAGTWVQHASVGFVFATP